jgi:hypothetical protein
MDPEIEKIEAAYGDQIDGIIDTTDDPEARVVDGSVGEVVSAEDYLKDPGKYAAVINQPAPDPLGLGKIPEPTGEKVAVERGPESVAAEEARYIRQALQIGATNVRSSLSCVEAYEHIRKLLGPKELAKVKFTNFESNIEPAKSNSIDKLFGMLGR